MTRDEFEARKRRLEEDLRSGTELLQAAFRTQLRALELVWMGVSGEPATTPPASPPPAAAAPEPRRHTRPSVGKVHSDLLAALRDLPEVFDRGDICRALGYEPGRVALYRLLSELVQDGTLRVEVRGEGRRGTRYRRS